MLIFCTCDKPKIGRNFHAKKIVQPRNNVTSANWTNPTPTTRPIKTPRRSPLEKQSILTPTPPSSHQKQSILRSAGEKGAMAKCGRIQSIVRLQQTLRRWRSRAASAAPVPSGHVAVCVGGGSRRFLVRAAHLNHPVFRELLRQSEEEYGFPSTPGPVALPCCDEDRFLDVLRRVSSEDRRGRSLCCRVPVVTTRDVAARPLLQGMAMEKLVW